MNKQLMRELGFGKAVDMVESGKCPTCGDTLVAFRDVISEKEYKISGMCQNCQDSVFVSDED
jgi:hypothetical protein